MTDKEPIAPTLEELSEVKVENSRFFGVTNATGKVLALLSLGTLGAGATGIAQGLGYMGPVLGATLPLGVGFAVVGVSVVAGLAGYWLGNFDDRHISEHNQNAAWNFRAARGTVREKIEQGFIGALSKAEFDPKQNSLPHDALGYAVMLADDKIASLPDHIRLDVYRTQLDLEVYSHARLTSANALEGQKLTRAIMALPTVAEQADAYKAGRDRVRTAIQNGTFTFTAAAGLTAAAAEEEDFIAGDIAEAVADALAHMARGAGRASGSSSTGYGGFAGGGGSFGGGGASGNWGGLGGGSSGGGGASGRWGVAAIPPVSDGQLGGLSDSFAKGSSGGSSGFKMPDMDVDGDAAKGLIVVAGVAAVVAACAVAGCSVWKNFISRAEKPAFGNVQLPLLAKSLTSAESKIRQMYKS